MENKELIEALSETLEDAIERCASLGLDPDKYSTVIKAKSALLKLSSEKHFTELTKDEQEDINEKDLREMKHYYGSWDELKKVIAMLEDNDNEAAYERHTSGGSDAWSGGFAENH